MSDPAFYIRESDPDLYASQEATVGPWDPNLQHGGPVAALLATRMENQIAEGTRISHFSLEFLSAVPKVTLEVNTDVIRHGKKIALYAARATVGGRDVALASAWALSAAEGRSQGVHDHEPPPPIPENAVSTYFAEIPHFPYGDALEWRFAEGGFRELGPATVWTKLRVAIVRGEKVSPLARILAMVDAANGISAELDILKNLFVPVNLTVSLMRHPTTEWVGMRAVSSINADGIGITRTKLFDETGTIGEALQTLYVERR